MNRAEKILYRDALLDDEFNKDIDSLNEDVKNRFYTHPDKKMLLTFAYCGYLTAKKEFHKQHYE